MLPRATTFFDQQDISMQAFIVQEYMQNIDTPDWYRGLSAFQLRAAHSLTASLRDDLEQDTSYRVRSVLIAIGLRPLVPKKKVRFTMKLSRGNDLAFLWFLKDMFYKSDEPSDTYNLNEQILLTCIAHLDLLYTLRGLDMILPPEQKPSMSQKNRIVKPFEYIDKQLKANQPRKPIRPRRRRKRRSNGIATIKKVYKLPYLNAIRKPRPYGKSLTAHPPGFLLHLKFLDVYKDKNYIIPNAHNRWFADYQINYARQSANSIINQNIDDMFQLNIAKVPNIIFDAQVFKNLKLADRPSIDTAVYQKKMLCAQHQVLAELEENLEHELQVIARDKCLKYFDVAASKKEERIARLRKQIENDVNMHMQRFKELTNKSQSSLLITSGGNLQKCSKCSLNCEMYKKQSRLSGGKENKSKSDPEYCYVLTECGIERKRVCKCKCKEKPKPKPLKERNINNACLQKQYRKAPCETEIIGDCLKHKKHWKSPTDEIFIIPSNEKVKIPRLRRLCSCGCTCTSHDSSLDSTQEYMRNYNYGHTDTSSLCSNTNAYFDAPKKDQPYKFDYPHIFDMKSPYDPKHLRKMCIKAIASDDGVKSERKCQTKSKESIHTAINEYAERTFKENVQRYNEENAERITETDIKAPNIVTRTYYDPNDTALMHSMLEAGLKRLASDKRYVLPTLPDAHKMPILRYWMYQRYGKVYARKELMKTFKNSMLIFRALNKVHVNVRLPKPQLIGRAVYTDYSCHDYLMKKSEHVRNLFYDSMDKSIMEQTRRLFMAMSPYLCTGRPLNKTIFAYLPARPSDIHHFHVWNSKTSKRNRLPTRKSI